MFKKLIFILFLLMFASGAFAATSESYAISAEVIDLGGASMESTGYRLFSKLRENVPEVTTSSSYTLEGRFMGVVYGTGAFSTFETPVITSISPNQGYNTASYEVVIRGWNISSDAIASLTAPLQSPIYGTNITVETSTSMECKFDLTGADPGKRNVVVTNMGYGKNGSLAGGFTVKSPGKVAIIGVPINEPNPVNPSAGPTMIKYTLNTSATITLYLFNQKGELIWQKTIPSGQNGGSAGNNSVPWNAISSFNEEVPTGVYLLSIVSRSDGTTKELRRMKIAVLRR